MAKCIYKWQHTLDGQVIGEIRRLPDGDGGKQDLPFYIKAGGHWTAGALPAPRPLFGIDSFQNNDRPLIVCEGQKVCTAFHGLGFQAVSLVGGAYSYDQADYTPIKEKSVKKIWFAPDNDQAGEHCMQAVWNHVRKFQPVEMKVIRLPGLKAKGDLCDWLKLQPELEDWNELDPLAGHPKVVQIRKRLEDTIAVSMRMIEWTPWDEWKAPTPVDTRLRPVRRMPESLIPPAIRPWLIDVQKRMGCPLEYLAIPAIIAAGAAIGTSCTVRPKQKAPWAVVPNNFGAIVGPPSTMKTAAIEAALAPLEQLDSESYAEFEKLEAEYEKEKFIYDQKMTAIKEQGRDAARKEGGGKYRGEPVRVADVADELDGLSKPKEPKLSRFIVKDATKEAITPILTVNPRGIIICLDELVQLIAGWEKEGRQGERQFHLQAWNGNQAYTVDRASFTKGQRIPKLCESIVGGMQPDTLKKYLVDFTESSNDGMIQRFQLMVYLDAEDNLEDEDIDEYEDDAAKFNYNLTFKQLCSVDWTQRGATPVVDNSPFYRFSDEIELDEYGKDPDSAQSLWIQWRAILKEKTKKEENTLIQQHLSKYPSLMPSLALIFHCMDVAMNLRPAGQISREATQRAIDWCELLEDHARRIYEMSKPIDLVLANALAQQLKANKLGGRFSIRDVMRKNWSSLKKSSDIMNACRQLGDMGWLKQVHTKAERGGQPKIEFLVNPEIIDDQAI
jgi:hypothetical protein